MDKKIIIGGIVGGAIAVAIIGYVVWRDQENGNGGSGVIELLEMTLYDNPIDKNPITNMYCTARIVGSQVSHAATTDSEGVARWTTIDNMPYPRDYEFRVGLPQTPVDTRLIDSARYSFDAYLIP